MGYVVLIPLAATVFFSLGRHPLAGLAAAFAGVSGDFNPLHTDETFAAKTPARTRIAHGMLSMAVATGLANQMGIFKIENMMQGGVDYAAALQKIEKEVEKS